MELKLLTYLFTAIELTPCGSSRVHIYTQTIQRKIQLTNWEEWGPCPVFASCTLAFALQMRKKHGKTSVRVAEECQLARWKQNIQDGSYITIRIHNLQNSTKVYKIYNYMHNSFIDTNLIHNFYINYIKLSSSTCFEQPPAENENTRGCIHVQLTSLTSWRWADDARNM